MIDRERSLLSILSNRTTGSVGLTEALLQHIEQNSSFYENKRNFLTLSQRTASTFPGMAIIINTLAEIYSSLGKLPIEEILQRVSASIREETERSCRNAVEIISSFDSVGTISESSLVIKALSGLDLSIWIPESRPALEGKLAAISLAESGVNVHFTTDYAIGTFIDRIDAFLVGVDCFTSEKFVNKTGTKLLALAARHYNKPFYAIGTKRKYIHNLPARLKSGIPSELWGSPPHGVTVESPYLEAVEISLLTGLILEDGIFTSQDVKKLDIDHRESFYSLLVDSRKE